MTETAPASRPDRLTDRHAAPRRLLFLVNDLRFGGAEKHVISLLNLLDTREFELHLLRLGPREDLLEQLEPNRIAGNRVVRRRSRFSLEAVGEVADYIDRHQISTVVCVNEYPMIYAYLGRQRAWTKPRLVEIFHTTDLLGRKSEFKMRAVYRRLFARFDAVVFVSGRQRAIWTEDRRMRTRRALTIHNGVDGTSFTCVPSGAGTAVRTDWGLDPDDFVVGMCAAFRPEKRHTDVLAAVASLIQGGLPAKLLLIGEGQERPRIEAAARRLAIEDRVVITGFQPDVRPMLGACDVMVLASTAVETFSIAVLEAMAMCRPVVSSDIGGAREQIEDGVTGFVFAPGRTEQLVDRLTRAADPDLRQAMGRAARSKVEREFTVERMVAHYSELFLSLGVDDGGS